MRDLSYLRVVAVPLSQELSNLMRGAPVVEFIFFLRSNQGTHVNKLESLYIRKSKESTIK